MFWLNTQKWKFYVFCLIIVQKFNKFKKNIKKKLDEIQKTIKMHITCLQAK